MGAELGGRVVVVLLFFLDKSRNLSKIVSVLRSASVERFDFSRMRDFLNAELDIGSVVNARLD